MNTNQITMDNTFRRIGKTDSQRTQWKNAVHEFVNKYAPKWAGNTNHQIKAYSLGARHTHTIKDPKKLYIFGYATFSHDNVQLITLHGDNANEYLIVGNVGVYVKDIYPPTPPSANIVDVKAECGTVIAQYMREENTLNIMFDIFNVYTPELEQVMDYIFSVIGIELDGIMFINSFIHSRNKEALFERLKDDVKRREEGELENLKREIRQSEESATAYRQNLTTVLTKLERDRVKISSFQSSADARVQTYIKEFELIGQHEKVEDLYVEGDKIIIHTQPLIIHDAESGKRYYGGKYRIVVKVTNSEVTFHANEGQGYNGWWTERDPHPHVNGSGGSACLGNAASTIAELCSQNQLYPLALVLIDFLESVNTADSAGKNVVNWPLANADGTKGSVECDNDEEYVTCSVSGARIHRDNTYWDNLTNEYIGEQYAEEGRDEHENAIWSTANHFDEAGYERDDRGIWLHPDLLGYGGNE